MPVAIIGNLLVMLAVYKLPSLKTPSNVLLACLAFSDFLIGLVVQPLFVIYRVMENVDKRVPCDFRVAYSESFWVCYGVSFMMLSAISFER
ncbi:Trace amine-associated receptor 9 [Exaiptasia diaphana]|nr:Trace amine-associated receptor 9 [Exaiptasia diaphana]